MRLANILEAFFMIKNLTIRAFGFLVVTGSQLTHAITPWDNGAPYMTVYISGAVAQTKGYAQAVSTALAASGSVDTFNDVDPNTGSIGSRWTAHYFTGNSALGTALAGKNILLVRRTVGGSGDGVIPLIGNLPLEHLNIASLPKTSWVADGTQAWKQTISASNAATFLTKKVSDGGVIAVDPYILLKPGSDNYPDPQPELTTGLPIPNWSYSYSVFPSRNFTVTPTGGLIYGVAVTLDLYKALQAAQIHAGTLPNTVTVGNYSESDMPSLGHSLIASLISGKIGAWDQIKIVDKSDSNKVKSLDDSTLLLDAKVSAPYKESTTGKNLTPVALGLRNNGAATSVIAYSVFLDYPATSNAVHPATLTPNTALDEDAALPIVKKPVIVADTGNLLKDWQNGTNVLGFNNIVDGLSPAKRWGIALNSADRNNSVTTTGTGGDPWRYIKIDGYAPTLENVAAGTYNYWAEGVVLYKNTTAANKKIILNALAQAMGSPAVLGTVTTSQPWGKTGAFATTKDPRGFTASLPFSPANPVVPFTHFYNGAVHSEVVPVADPGAVGGLSVQMK